MNARRSLLALPWLLLAQAASAQSLQDILKEAGRLSGTPGSGTGAGAADAKTSAAGIKEALAVGTERAITSLSKVDGYFGNAAVKILMPPKLQQAAELARMAGYQKQVDAFVLSMNRAAEAAAPRAARYFSDAIRAMSLSDAHGILTGGDTAATDYFRRATQDKLYAEFKPVVSQKVGEAGVARAYKNMMSRYESLPMVGKLSLDVDDYVTNKALDGLFTMVAQEEKQIRSNPAARTTDLLKKVFGK